MEYLSKMYFFKHGRPIRSAVRLIAPVLVVMTLLMGIGGTDQDAWGGWQVLWNGTEVAPPNESGRATLINELGDERLVTAGLGIRTSDTSSFVLRSYDAFSGDLIVEDEFELVVDEESEAAIEAGQGRVYAVGSGLNDEGRLSLIVRAYDAHTGVLLWEDELNPLDEPRARTASGKARGQRTHHVRQHDGFPSTAQSHFLVEASDPQTGEIIWEDQFLTNSRQYFRRDRAFLLSDKERTQPRFSIVIRTYDPTTGDLLWEDRFNPDTRPGKGNMDGTALTPGQSDPGRGTGKVRAKL